MLHGVYHDAAGNEIAADVLRVDPYRGIFRIIPSEKNEEIHLLHWSDDDFSDFSFIGNLFSELKKQAAAAGREITLEKVCPQSLEEMSEELGSRNISTLLSGKNSADKISEKVRLLR